MFFIILLSFIFFCNFFCLLFIPAHNPIVLRNIGFFFSLFIFIVVIIMWFNFNFSSNNLQWFVHLPWNDSINIYFSGGLDGISLLFILLTSLLFPLCILYSWFQFQYILKELFLILFFLEFLLFNFFFVSDLFFFLYFLKLFYFLCLYL